MKAIIVPLNKMFLDFEKYDGSTIAERFRRRNPKLVKFLLKGGQTLVVCIAAPIFVVTLIYIALPYLFNLIFHGKKKADRVANIIVDKMILKFALITEKKRKNIFELVNTHQKQGYELLVYYSPEMIPSSKQDKFYSKIEAMKQKLKIFHVFQATTQEEIEKVIILFGINSKESIFIPDENIIPSNHKQINTHSNELQIQL